MTINIFEISVKIFKNILDYNSIVDNSAKHYKCFA